MARDHDWSNFWWAADLPYLMRLYWHSYSVKPKKDVINRATNQPFPERDSLGAVGDTVDSVISDITWVLEQKPKFAFLALDSGRSNRKQIFPEYKMSRLPPPPEFRAAYNAVLRDLADEFKDRVHIVAAPGFEADDVMATLAKQAVKAGDKCVLMTNDKDIRQCLRAGQVTSQRRMNDDLGRATWGFLTCAQAEADWGVTKEQFIDYQILTGDDTDGIPGADWVGAKTAAKLLLQHGSIEHLKKASVPGKVGDSLANFWEMEPLVRELVTLNEDVDYVTVPIDQTDRSFSDGHPKTVDA